MLNILKTNRPRIAYIFLLMGLPLLPSLGHAEDAQIGLIDMAHVFKNYDKFVDLTEQLQNEVKQSDEVLRPRVEGIKKLQEQMKDLSPTSAEYEQLEGQLVNAQADLRKIQLQKQREFVKKETELYKSIYLEVTDAVDRYSNYYKYTLILRFSRNPVTGEEDPQKLMQGMNRQVLYHRNRDDLTDPVLKFLNGQWQKERTAIQPAGATTR